ncbi:MAG: hypothetical protein HZA88_03280 [Verrucomicrobia bacterium]|nr:hypothetical protein [Verrucomicrobiota bacterium]
MAITPLGMAQSPRIEMADDWDHVTAHGKAPRLAGRVAEDKALQKAMAEVMKKISD